MQYINPNCYHKTPVLGSDGCVYEYVNEQWSKIYDFAGWKVYVIDNYIKYVNREIILDDFIDNLTYNKKYKDASGYTGKLTHHFFGSGQYHSIYKMYLFLHIIEYCGLDTKSFIGSELSDFIPNKNYQENLINKIKADRLEFLVPDTNVYLAICKHQIIYDTKKWRADDDGEQDYYWSSCPLDKISKQHLEILEKKVQEFELNIRNELKDVNLSTEDFKKIIKRFCENPDVKYKVNREIKIEKYSDYIFDENEIMWDHDDLVHGCPHSMSLFGVPYKALDKDKQFDFLIKSHESTVKNLSKLVKMRDFLEAIKYFMDSSDMWCAIPRVFKMIYNKEIQPITAPTIKSDHILNDWSDNYRLGIQIYIMVKNGIVKYVNDFYCPNT